MSTRVKPYKLTEEEAEVLALTELGHLFKRERMKRLLRQHSEAFPVLTPLELIRYGQISLVRERYENALRYQA